MRLTRRSVALPPRAGPALITLGIAVAAALIPNSVGARQTLAELTATPERTAELFLRSVRAIRWSTAEQFMHPRTITRFHAVVTMLSDADTTGDVRRYLTGTDSAGYRALEPGVVFDRAVGTMIDSLPGLMHAIFDHDDRVIGHVLESPDSAHVVYRTLARISGAVPEVKVMQLERTAGGWRVLWSDELEVLETALRGVPRGRIRRDEWDRRASRVLLRGPTSS
jgi:hypothetical protein